MNLELIGRRAVVTGASRGIGAAISLALANEGADLALIGRDHGALNKVAGTARERGSAHVLAVPCDMADRASALAGVGTAAQSLGGVDILVNCAGTSRFGAWDELSEQDWVDAFQLKVLGYVRAIEAVIPSMRAQHSGRIVNVVGMASKLPTPGYVLGCLNAALLHITKTFADALASDGISVVAVNPGATATSRIRTALETWAKAAGQRVDEYTVEYERSIPLGRLGTPAEVASVVAFICSDRASYVTGSCVNVDGGAIRGAI